MPLDPFIGQIMPAGFGFAPKGWHACDGTHLPIKDYQALYALIGTTFGGSPPNFALPDLRGRANLGSDINRTVPWGQVSGTETVQLTVGQLPAHNHTVQASTAKGTGRPVNPTGQMFGETTSGEMIFGLPGSGDAPLGAPVNLANDGGSQPHNNMQPYLAINYVIALTGIFPPRP